MNKDKFAPLSVEEKVNSAEASVVPKKQSWQAIMPVPEDAIKPSFKHPKYGKPEVIYEYKDKDSRLLYYTCRFEGGDAEKAILPYSCGRVNEKDKLSWGFKAPSAPRPLYGLDRYSFKKEDTTVIIVEGEKCAEAAKKLFPQFIVITSMGGANSFNSSDWTTIILAKKVYIMPDNDEVGRKYANDVAKLLTALSVKNIYIINFPPDSKPEKWDVADAFLDGWTKKEARQFVKDHKKKFKSLPTLSFEEVMNLNIPDPNYYLPWLKQGGLGMVYAHRGLGKTFFCLSVATSLCTGDDFLHWKVSEKVGVLYIDGEMSLSEYRDRVKGLIDYKRVNNLEVFSHEFFYHVEEKDINLVEDEMQQRIKEHIDANPNIKVVILDNLSCLFPTIKEDKRDDWATHVLPFLIWFRRRGISLIMVHHTNKKGEQRGTSSREDILDFVIELSPLPDRNSGGKAGFYVEFKKSRSVYGDVIEPLEADLIESNGKLSWEWKLKEQSSEDRLLSLVKNDGINTVKMASEELKMTEGAVSKIKKKLISKGLLKDIIKLELA